ncbi:MAG: M48 family metallopeptidase, partial [Deinococcus sp.]
MTPVSPAGPLLEGSYFDGLTSREQPARAGVQGEQLVMRTLTLEARFPLREVRIEPGLPGMRRVLKLPGGARLETGSLEGVAALERRLRRNPGLRMVARLEGRWPYALLAVLGMLLFVAGFVRFGLPLAAGLAARLTPVAVMRGLDEQTARAIDGRYLKPTRLPPARRARIEAGFRRLAAERGGPYRFRLLFRDGGGSVGANAFALPGGTVFLTDELVRLARGDAELMGVLAHELGHVEHRHAMQGVYQG